MISRWAFLAFDSFFLSCRCHLFVSWTSYAYFMLLWCSDAGIWTVTSRISPVLFRQFQGAKWGSILGRDSLASFLGVRPYQFSTYCMSSPLLSWQRTSRIWFSWSNLVLFDANFAFFSQFVGALPHFSFRRYLKQSFSEVQKFVGAIFAECPPGDCCVFSDCNPDFELVADIYPPEHGARNSLFYDTLLRIPS